MRPVRKAGNLTTFLCAFVIKSGNLKFLEPSGPLQACNGTDLSFLPYFDKYETYFTFKLPINECIFEQYFLSTQTLHLSEFLRLLSLNWNIL